ncbi:DNA-binding transcriptional regulator, MarR family [Amycolatopsis arida]|uniref:DNA-binding transcriptional regulator, MarR family n=1 Tax=Amycolatopsis arida TaxID=587909 RepID=A0A1I5TTF2_9PSEU|nr:MarR family transcriptional regulator [Amycolatopsis arida]TDX95997.1 DNA-binding MarR family transcriptional regulator [Amycolatopsis arida]SFP85606.1 DNA-binding transcriptional regulator, MarR family [Amycolatopsis arida]
MRNSEVSGAELGRELSTAVVMFHEAMGARLGVSAGDQRALAVIARNGPLSAGQLAEEVGLTPGAVTGMVDRLERAGLVRREPDLADRRRVLISVTEAEADTRAEAFGPLAAAMAELVDGYTEHERRVIADYVTRTVEVLRAQTQRLTGQPAD